MGAGRPEIKTSDFPETWKEDVLKLASEGASIVELAVNLNISRDTFYELAKRDEEFSDTIKRCKELSECWWENKGRTNLENKDFNYTGWYMNMKNRFKWKDRHDITSDDEPITTVSVKFENYKDDE